MIHLHDKRKAFVFHRLFHQLLDIWVRPSLSIHYLPNFVPKRGLFVSKILRHSTLFIDCMLAIYKPTFWNLWIKIIWNKALSQRKTKIYCYNIFETITEVLPVQMKMYFEILLVQMTTVLSNFFSILSLQLLCLKY